MAYRDNQNQNLMLDFSNGGSGKQAALQKLMSQFDGEIIKIDPSESCSINIFDALAENMTDD